MAAKTSAKSKTTQNKGSSGLSQAQMDAMLKALQAMRSVSDE